MLKAALCFLTVIEAEGFQLPSQSKERGVSVRVRVSSSSKEDLPSELTFVNPVTGFISRFLPRADEDKSLSSASSSISSFSALDWEAPKESGLPLQVLASKLDRGLTDREWFVTGDVLPELFDEKFSFKDPDVSLEGIQAYAAGVSSLFDRSSRAEIFNLTVAEVASDVDGCSGLITVEWRLSGGVNIGPMGLKLKPFVVTTKLHVSKASGLVLRQEDAFSIPSYDILISALVPALRPLLAPEAPPVPPRVPLVAAKEPSMKRPFLDGLATALFNLETRRVSSSIELGESGRQGEPMTWAESSSLANQFSAVMASGPGYLLKQVDLEAVMPLTHNRLLT